MKIEMPQQNNNEVYFEVLNAGDLFMFNGCVYLKIVPNTSYVSSDNAFNLNNNKQEYIYLNSSVVKVNGTLTIEYDK
jgi:hypothetical protein